MPNFIAYIGSTVLSKFGAVTLANSFAASLAVGIATVGYVTYAATQLARLRNAGGKGAQPGAPHQLLVRSTKEPRKIVYGEALVSGPLVWMNVNSDVGRANSSLYSVVALTGHQCQSFQGFYLDDRFIPIADVDTAGDGSVDADTNAHGYGPLNSLPVVYFRQHLGAAAQTVDTMLDAGFTQWTSNHRGRGVGYVVIRMDRTPSADELWAARRGSLIPGIMAAHRNLWAAGAPSNISVLVRGKLVYDPRLDSTFSGSWGTGSGAHRVNDPTTWAYSFNPALCLADYMIDVDLGVGMPTSEIDYNDVAIAADACDANVAIPVSTTQDRFTCNVILSTADTHRENIEKLLSSMAGSLRQYNGQYHIAAGVWPASSSFTLDESHLVGPITFRAQPERTERYNGVRGLYFDPGRKYKESQYLQVEDTALQAARDQGQEIWKELDLHGTNNEYTAQRIALRAAEQASRCGLLVFPTGYNGLNIAPGDRGTVSLAELGWVAKNFRCIGLRHIDMVGVELTLKEDDSAAYTDPVEGDYGTRTAAAVVTTPKVRRSLGEDAQLFDDFVYVSADELHMRWTKRQGGVADGDISLITGLTDVPGGQAVRFGNNSGNDEWWGAMTSALIAYDPNSTYEIGVIARRVTGSGLLTCGFEGVANDRTTLVNTSGSDAYTSQHFVAASGAAPGSSWTTYLGYVRGHGTTPTSPANDPSAPSVMRTNVTFIRPMLLVNYNAQAGQMDVAALWVRRSPVIGTPNIGLEAATEVATTTDASTTASALDTTDLQYAASTSMTVGTTTDVFEVTCNGISTITHSGGTPSAPEAGINLRYRVNGGGWALMALNIGRPTTNGASDPFAIAGSVTGITAGATIEFAVEAVAVEVGGTGTLNHALTQVSLVATQVKR